MLQDVRAALLRPERGPVFLAPKQPRWLRAALLVSLLWLAAQCAMHART
jgi:hypothetical protein